MKDYFVYILSDSAATLYIGVTSNLDQRLFDHANHDPKPYVAGLLSRLPSANVLVTGG